MNVGAGSAGGSLLVTMVVLRDAAGRRRCYPAGGAPHAGATDEVTERSRAYGTITTCGGLVPSRLENSAVFVDPDVASNE